MKLDRQAAATAVEGIADKVGIAGEDRAIKAAEAALQVTTAVMSTELYKGLAQRGEDPRDFTLMAYGGAGPTHANLLAQEARLKSIVVPPAPSTFCAMGAILADVKRDYVRSRHLRFDEGEKAAATWPPRSGSWKERLKHGSERKATFSASPNSRRLAICATPTKPSTFR